MHCNIDARGQRVRLISGLLTLTFAMIVAVLAITLGGWWWWAIAAAAALIGPFQIFEARKGWCALRAMGMKTPI